MKLPQPEFLGLYSGGMSNWARKQCSAVYETLLTLGHEAFRKRRYAPDACIVSVQISERHALMIEAICQDDPDAFTFAEIIGDALEQYLRPPADSDEPIPFSLSAY